MRIAAPLLAISFILALPFGANGSQAAKKRQSPVQNECAELLTNQKIEIPSRQDSIHIADFLKNGSLADAKLQVTFYRSPDETIIELAPPNDGASTKLVLATIIYSFDPVSSALHVKGMEVHLPSLRGQGLSRVLLALALRDYPKTQQIRSELTLDNLEAIAQAFKKSADEYKAAFATPAYKIRESLGFGKIVSSGFRVSPNNDYFWYELVVER